MLRTEFPDTKQQHFSESFNFVFVFPFMKMNIFEIWKEAVILWTDNTMSKKKVTVIVVNATFNNISVISWRSVLLVGETEVPRENPQTCRKSVTNFIT